jgi:hypothetical protein
MRRIVIAFSICIATLASSQDRANVVVPSTAVSKGPQWNKGIVEAGVYKNASLGVELSPPPGLDFDAPDLKGNPGTVPLLVTINALGKSRLLSGREVMSFYSDALAYYPENRRSTGDYVRRVVFGNKQEGWTPEERDSDSQMGGVTFTRKNFRKEGRYEAVLMKACRAQALVLIFAGNDEDEVNKLITSTKLNLDPAISGCAAESNTPAKH